ncbi:transcriptional regulator [Rhodomicrobium udaipurense JA643]|uniref:SIR2 family protein n=1 Tax=Rhodomicrobium udaipurense TaxID=1202716 RepID=A0A8I1GIG3_9HYPH|nr:SIR2 family protein [Rhodomicrobium udaipurense]KAI94155.1 transcriptional regulator [Rhodomicrobium udaipurense JA643]MBJ7545091.1 SIR2 family protein [Rhodomicrobium udaipurense]
MTNVVETIREGLNRGTVIPYLGPGILKLAGTSAVPEAPEILVDRLTAKASVPHKIRKNLTAAAQFIENFKHRKTVAAAMTEAFRSPMPPTALHHYLASVPALKLIVHAWYDDLPQKALAGRAGWSMVQGVSQAEHHGSWYHFFNADGTPGTADTAAASAPLLYQPIGSIAPASNFLVSDSDFVEVLTEIDIQTPIPEAVQDIRKGRSFVFLGCRFNTQLERIFAWEIMKRSSDKHWAVLPETLTRNEERFLEIYNVERIVMPLAEFAAQLTGIDERPYEPALAKAS